MFSSATDPSIRHVLVLTLVSLSCHCVSADVIVDMNPPKASESDTNDFVVDTGHPALSGDQIPYELLLDNLGVRDDASANIVTGEQLFVAQETTQLDLGNIPVEPTQTDNIENTWDLLSDEIPRRSIIVLISLI